MNLYPELAGLSLDELVKCLRGSGGYDDYYEEVVDHIAAFGSAGINCLLAELDRRQHPQALAVIDKLFRVDSSNPIFGAELRALLEDREPELVAEAIVALGFLGAEDVRHKVLASVDHPSPEVRSAVLQYARRICGESAAAILIAALSDRSDLVRESAIDELDDLGAVGAITHLRPLVEDSAETVRQAARTAIANLTELAAQERQARGLPHSS
ncbi:HEAT repeat domain-containing protein [Nocardia sp. SSK8]|uniref:HEAT repeat domain-containing protein n=1 Tax=Nocardia sp. SSK8 TaxID=3120154 RepID=UPI003008A2D0